MPTYYQYLTPVVSTEHMLYASEVSVICGLYTLSGKSHPTLVKALIRQYANEQGVNPDQYYFVHRGKVNAVYPRVLYEPAMLRFLEGYEYDTSYCGVKIEGKSFNFIIRSTSV